VKAAVGRVDLAKRLHGQEKHQLKMGHAAFWRRLAFQRDLETLFGRHSNSFSFIVRRASFIVEKLPTETTP